MLGGTSGHVQHINWQLHFNGVKHHAISVPHVTVQVLVINHAMDQALCVAQQLAADVLAKATPFGDAARVQVYAVSDMQQPQTTVPTDSCQCNVVGYQHITALLIQTPLIAEN